MRKRVADSVCTTQTEEENTLFVPLYFFLCQIESLLTCMYITLAQQDTEPPRGLGTSLGKCQPFLNKSATALLCALIHLS